MIERLRANLGAVRARIEAACRRAGRDPGTVTLVAVTKSVGVPVVEALLELGQRDLGENRAVEGAERVAGLRRPATWHFIGRLQTNKARKVLEAFQVLHSLDRHDLAGELEKRLSASGRVLPVYVQANVSGEASKSGWSPPELPDALARVREACPHLRVEGLMTMAPEGPAGSARPHFRALREAAGRLGLGGLSMGMSGDFEEAVEEGATIVRVGTALFEGLNPQ